MGNIDNNTKEQLLVEIDQLKSEVTELKATGRKTIEKELQESYSLLTSIVESLDNIIMFALDTNYNYLSFNQAHAKEMKFIYDVDIEVGKFIFSFMPNKEDIQKAEINYKRVLKGERFIEIQEYGDADNRFWYELIFNPIYDDSENVTGFTVFVTNITERKQTEIALKESGDLLKKLTAQVPGTIYQFLLRPDGTSCFPYASKGIKDIYGVTHEQVKTSADLVFAALHPDDIASVSENIQQSANELSPWRDEYRVILPGEKEPSWREGYAMPERLEDGSTLWHGFITNIDQRKLAKEKLRESEENFQQVVSNITTAVWQADIGEDGTFGNQYTSPVFDELLGLPARGSTNNWDNHLRYVKPEYLERVDTAFREAIESPGKTIDLDFEVLKDNGQTAWFNSKGRCFEKDGKLHVFGSTTDITESKKTEQELLFAKEKAEESEVKFKTLVTNNEEIIYMIDINGIFLLSEGKGLKKLGIKPGQVVGESVFDNYKDYPDMLADMKKTFKGESLTVEHMIGDMYFISRYTPHKNSSGEVIGLLGLSVDITARKHVEEELENFKTLLNETEKTSKIGGWAIDLETMTQTWTEETYRIHEVDMDYEPDVSKGISFYTPSAQPIIESAINNTIETGEPFDLELEFITAKGRNIWVHSVGKARQENGVTKSLSGSFQDITDRKLAEVELAKHRNHLEEMVNERTKELDEKNKKLDNAMKVFVGRELTIKKLQDRIRALEGK